MTNASTRVWRLAVASDSRPEIQTTLSPLWRAILIPCPSLVSKTFSSRPRSSM